VVADRRIDGLQVPQTVGDDYACARIATEHLLSLGHTRITHLAIPLSCSAGRDRAKGFEDAMREAGVSFDASSIIPTEFGEHYGMKAMQLLLESDAPPTAIIARHDVVAIGAMRAVFAAGLSVPEDVSIIGAGGLWFNDIVRIPLTTVEHPMQKIAAKASEKLLALLAGEAVPSETEILEVELVIRCSTAPPKSH